VQTGPPALLRSQVRHLLLLRFIGLAAPRRLSGWRRREQRRWELRLRYITL